MSCKWRGLTLLVHIFFIYFFHGFFAVPKETSHTSHKIFPSWKCGENIKRKVGHVFLTSSSFFPEALGKKRQKGYLMDRRLARGSEGLVSTQPQSRAPKRKERRVFSCGKWPWDSFVCNLCWKEQDWLLWSTMLWALTGEVADAGEVYKIPEQLYSRRNQQPPGYFMQSPVQEHLLQDLHEIRRLDTAPQPRVLQLSHTLMRHL